MAELQTLAQLKAPPQADPSRPWTDAHTRTLELVRRYESAVQRYRPRFRLGAFLQQDFKIRRQIDPRDVMMFKSCFRHLDTRAQDLDASAEELIAAFVEHYGPMNKTDAMFHKPNTMLNRELARWLLGRWRDNIAGKSAPREIPGRERAQAFRATALLAERAQASIASGWRRLGLFLFKGRLAERFEPWWVEVETVQDGAVATLGPADQVAESLLTRTYRIPVARPMVPVMRALLENRAWQIPEGYRELACAPTTAFALAEKLPGPTQVVRRHRRRWWDFVVGWLLADGAGLSREFLWGVAEGIVPMPKPVVAEAREAMHAATGVAGDDYDPAKRWSRSALTEWHRDAWAAELDPLLLVLAEAERVGRTADPFAGEWAGPVDPTPMSRTYTAAQATRLRARAPKYL